MSFLLDKTFLCRKAKKATSAYCKDIPNPFHFAFFFTLQTQLLLDLIFTANLIFKKKTESYICYVSVYVCSVVVSLQLRRLQLPGSSIHEIFQARTLKWEATSYSRGSS